MCEPVFLNHTEGKYVLPIRPLIPYTPSRLLGSSIQSCLVVGGGSGVTKQQEPEQTGPPHQICPLYAIQSTAQAPPLFFGF